MKYSSGSTRSAFPVLIETLWNVKIISFCHVSHPRLVLIETLWNVKQDLYFNIAERYSVLIETLWNVKVS